mgnify:FL=1
MEISVYKEKIRNATSDSIPKNYFDGYFNAFYSAYCEIKDLIQKDQEILDVGCGGGLLVNYLSTQGYKISGFDNYLYNPHTKAINNAINSKDLVVNSEIKDFKSKKKYDLIFLSNVIEHLHDWKGCLRHLEKLLKHEGRIVLLLPNYNFPVEFHFMIPIIINKSITYKIFKNRINNFEMIHKRHGIWDSLNFITIKQIKKFFMKNNYIVTIDKNYIKRLIIRLTMNAKNKNNEKRRNLLHSLLVIIANFFVNSNLINAYIYLPQSFHPFIKIIVTKKESVD